MFSDLSSGARLLIEGRPGSGKTTLVHKVSRDWPEEMLKFNHCKLLLLIHLRGFLNDPEVDLECIIKCYYHLQANFGLITVDIKAIGCGFQKMYTFLHLTFQEFLAAYHISHLKSDEQQDLITHHGESKHMLQVWKFYCGLVQFD